MKKFWKIVFALFLLGIIYAFDHYRVEVQTLSISFETKSLSKGKLSVSKADVYFNAASGEMISHFSKPQEIFIINNRRGDLIVYDPKKNLVRKENNPLMGTESNYFYCFANNEIDDLGLTKLGFKITSTKFENEFAITEWVAPAQYVKLASRVKIAHKDYLPIYSAYYNLKGEVIRKVYYYDFFKSPDLVFPMKITEILYESAKDSTITRTTFSNIKTDFSVDKRLSEFKIPKDAKLVQ